MDINITKAGLVYMKMAPRYFASKRSFKRKVKWLSKRAVTSIGGVPMEQRLTAEMGLISSRDGSLVGRDPVKDLINAFEDGFTGITVFLTAKDADKASGVISKSVSITYCFDVTNEAKLAITKREKRAVRNAFVKACFEDIVHKDIECSECGSNAIDDDTECRDCNMYRLSEYDEEHYIKTFKKGSGKLKRLA